MHLLHPEWTSQNFRSLACPWVAVWFCLILLFAVQSAPAQDSFAVQAAQSVYESTLLAYERLEKISGDFGDKPGFSGQFQVLVEDGEIRAVIVQFSQERAGDWHEYYFFNTTLRYAFTRGLNSEGMPVNYRYFLDDEGHLQRLDINERTVATATDASAELAGREISNLARQFYAVAKLEMLSQEPAELNDPNLLSSADLTGRSVSIPRAVVVEPEPELEPESPPLPDPLTMLPMTDLADPEATVDGEEPAAEADFAQKNAEVMRAMQLSILSRWADWANRTRADKAKRTPLPPDLLLDLSTPDPDAGSETAKLADQNVAEEQAALEAFIRSADTLESAGEAHEATSNATIRSGPGTNHGRIGRITTGTMILVISEAPDDPEWLIVRLTDADVELFDEENPPEQGYIFASLLKPL